MPEHGARVEASTERARPRSPLGPSPAAWNTEIMPIGSGSTRNAHPQTVVRGVGALKAQALVRLEDENTTSNNKVNGSMKVGDKENEGGFAAVAAAGASKGAAPHESKKRSPLIVKKRKSLLTSTTTVSKKNQQEESLTPTQQRQKQQQQQEGATPWASARKTLNATTPRTIFAHPHCVVDDEMEEEEETT